MALAELINLRADGQMKSLEKPPEPLWEQSSETPEAVRVFARSIFVQAPSDADWEGLTPLQRFALLKLSRDNHDNVNFIPALREFGLVGDSPQHAPSTASEEAIAHL